MIYFFTDGRKLPVIFHPKSLNRNKYSGRMEIELSTSSVKILKHNTRYQALVIRHWLMETDNSTCFTSAACLTPGHFALSLNLVHHPEASRAAFCVQLSAFCFRLLRPSQKSLIPLRAISGFETSKLKKNRLLLFRKPNSSGNACVCALAEPQKLTIEPM